MSITFNDLRPVLPFVVSVVDNVVFIKPFAGFHEFMTWFDLNPLDQSADIASILVTIDGLTSSVETAYETSVDALELATEAAGIAIDALNDAAAAQSTADSAAAAAAAAAAAPTFGVMMDEATWNVTPTRIVNSLYPYNYGVFHLSPAAMTKQFSAQGGTWDLHILTYKGNNAGQLTVAIDGVTVLLNLELYQASPTYSTYLHNLTGVTITGDGWHTLHLSCSSKHASSASYGLLVFKVFGERTGD